MISVSFENIDRVKAQLDQYTKEFPKKVKMFVELLTDEGITVARDRTADGSHQMPQRIRFEKKIMTDKAYVLGYITGIGDTLISDWFDADGIEHIDEVYPLSMLEFGSAAYALEPQEAYGGYGGRGTFSVSGNENKSQWYVNKVGEDGNMERTYATAIRPTRPMYNAMLEMQKQIEQCAKKAFGG